MKTVVGDSVSGCMPLAVGSLAAVATASGSSGAVTPPHLALPVPVAPLAVGSESAMADSAADWPRLAATSSTSFETQAERVSLRLSTKDFASHGGTGSTANLTVTQAGIVESVFVFSSEMRVET